MTMPKKMKIDCINRIKYEQRKEFKDSLFADVYRKAVQLASQIANDNIKDERNVLIDKEFCTEERFNNIISFWGERGMGKSSAMLSFALFLKRYDDTIRNDGFHLSVKETLVFHVLPRIDATMLIKGESLLDIILAKMWCSFDKKFRYDQDSEYNEVKKCFSKVKDSYERYQKSGTNECRFSMTSIRELEELSRCLNLRDDLRGLIYSYINYMEKASESIPFLVLVIDDLDMVVDDVYNTLEQIRLFLMIPRVIVLITAEYGRLYLGLKKAFLEKLIHGNSIEDRERKQIQNYVEKYLAKIFPGNMRIHMPGINTIGGINYEVEISNEDSASNKNGKNLGTADERRVLFTQLHKYTRIMLYPFDNRRHFLQKDSLRTIVNELHELRGIGKMKKEEQFKSAIIWIQNTLLEYSRTITNNTFYDTIQDLLKENWGSVNEGIIETLFAIPDIGGKVKKAGLGYGELLSLLLKMDEMGNYRELIRFVLVLYSTQLAEILKESQYPNERRKHVVSDMRELFYPAIREAILKGEETSSQENTDIDRLPKNCFQFDLQITENLKQGKDRFEALISCINENIGAINTVFKLVCLGEWNLWDPNNEESLYFSYKISEVEEGKTGEDIKARLNKGKEESEPINKEKEFVSLGVFSDSGKSGSKVSIEFMIWNALSYKENLMGFLKNILKALCEHFKINGDAEKVHNSVVEIAQNAIFKCKFYENWSQKFGIKEIWDILPLQSAEVMFELTKEISKIQGVNIDENILQRILETQSRQMNRLIEELEKIEEYYNIKKKYSEILKDYCEIMDPYSINTGEMRFEVTTSISHDTDMGKD